MKEIAICQNILNFIREKSYGSSFRRVTRIVLEVGEFSAIDKDALMLCFKESTKGTFAENAALHFFDVPASGFCESRKQLFLMRHANDTCTHCYSKGL